MSMKFSHGCTTTCVYTLYKHIKVEYYLASDRNPDGTTVGKPLGFIEGSVDGLTEGIPHKKSAKYPVQLPVGAPALRNEPLFLSNRPIFQNRYVHLYMYAVED
eukprot:scaffold421163_cov76-Attheya_sp.AAC.1